MPFRFSLQAVLRLRQSYEQRERLRLALLNASIGRLRQQYEDLEQQRLSTLISLEATMKEGMTVAELEFENAAIAERVSQQKALLVHIANLERERVAQLGAYREARKNRQILENLRSRQHKIYREIQARREQQEFNDLFVRRRRSTDFPT